jgi:spermidine synthase
VKPWEIIGRARTADGVELTLAQHTSEYVIRAANQTLMSSRVHGSEDALARLGCARAAALAQPCVLVGGLGMGFTLRATLDLLPPSAIILVAELVPAVIEWNRGPLGPLASHPLADARVRVNSGDVVDTIRANAGRFDAILLDIDNGPAALSATSNARLYDDRGIALCRAALRHDGTIALWSAADAGPFSKRLRAAGFAVRQERVRGRLGERGPRHTIVVAQRRESR